MKTIHAGDFLNLPSCPISFVFFLCCLSLPGYRKKKTDQRSLSFYLSCFGIIAMADFWKWEYNYGHNLNPDAAIIVPGMSYQPPLIGFKQLLNFGAYSIPDIGGWIFVVWGSYCCLSYVANGMLRDP